MITKKDILKTLKRHSYNFKLFDSKKTVINSDSFDSIADSILNLLQHPTPTGTDATDMNDGGTCEDRCDWPKCTKRGCIEKARIDKEFADMVSEQPTGTDATRLQWVKAKDKLPTKDVLAKWKTLPLEMDGVRYDKITPDALKGIMKAEADNQINLEIEWLDEQPSTNGEQPTGTDATEDAINFIERKRIEDIKSGKAYNTLSEQMAFYCMEYVKTLEPSTNGAKLEEFKKTTGHNSPAEWAAYDKGREDEQKVLMQFIDKWNGETNSALGELLKRKLNG